MDADFEVGEIPTVVAGDPFEKLVGKLLLLLHYRLTLFLL